MQEQEMHVKGRASWGLETAGLWLWEEQDSGAEPSLAPFPRQYRFVWIGTIASEAMAIPVRTDAFFATLLASDITRQKLHEYVSAPVLYCVYAICTIQVFHHRT